MTTHGVPRDAAADTGAAVTGAVRVRARLRVAERLRAGLSVLRRALGKAWQDRILGMSAESAFWQLLSLPSLLIAVLGALGYTARWMGPTAVHQIRASVLDTASYVVTPKVIDQVVAPVVSQILDHNRGEVIGLGSLIALWSGSSATATFVNTITIAYGQRDLRGALRSRLVALRLYLFTVAAGTVVLPAVVLGPSVLAGLFPKSWHGVVATVYHVLYWPVLAVIVFAGISLFYHVSTPVRLRWRRAFPGAAIALALFLVLSYLLQLYITEIASRMLVYSTLAAPILALMFFYALAFAILLGAEFNAALEERWPRGTARRPGEWLRDHATAARVRRNGSDRDGTDGNPTEGNREPGQDTGEVVDTGETAGDVPPAGREHAGRERTKGSAKGS